MRLLFACEFYAPSVGGVQEVVKQLAERMVQRGHQVTVATTRLPERDFQSLNGVEIVGFDIGGNLVRGMNGELERYREFVRTFPCDALMVKAAQQWTFDALWPVLDQLACRKVFIPCGFSGLYEPLYKGYFEQLPAILRQWDHLIFYAEHYRDVDFARAHGLDQFTILPNGASEVEFEVEPDPLFRQRHGVPEDSFLLLTVGSLTGMKGHREVAQAFAQLKLPQGRHATLLLNGNEPPRAPPAPSCAPAPTSAPEPAAPSAGMLRRATKVYREEGWDGVLARFGNRLGRPARAAGKIGRSLRADGVAVTVARIYKGVYQRTRHHRAWKLLPERWHPADFYSIQQWLAAANRDPQHKLALHVNFARAELVQAYLAADLFVFASNIEYSPLVLYEAAAAGTPFLTVPVGNSEEIARWTGAGVVCPAAKDDFGYTRVDPGELARAIASLAGDPAQLQALGKAGRNRWRDNFTWQVIAGRYEAILAGRAQPCKTMVLKETP